MKALFKHLKTDWYKYLFDIIVVILGIMIAFSLNNWNESKRQLAIEQQYYKDILQELSEDLLNIKENRAFNNYLKPRYSKAKDIILTDTEKQKVDELGRISLELMLKSDFKKEISIYDALSNSANLDLIGNKDILKQLQNLGSLYKTINVLESSQQLVITGITERILEYIRMDPFEVMEPDKLYHFRFQNIFEIYLHMVGAKETKYAQAESDIEALILSIREELN